tara:strand:- start:715 stop:1314 length:600 start_codon:yes stop_codon:yes gene_type:complete
MDELSQAGISNIFFVNDGSEDDTAQILTNNSINYVSHTRNLGKGAAIKTAASWAIRREYEWILTLDADLQHPLTSIPLFLNARGDNTVVVGSRRNLASMPFNRRFSNKFTSLLLSIRSNTLLSDSQCGFRLIPLKLFTQIKFFQNGFQFESEMLIKAALSGYRVDHVEIPTIYGTEKSAIRNFKDTVKFSTMYCHSFVW